MIDLSDVKIAPDQESVRRNAGVLKTKWDALKADLAVVEAMMRANQTLCTHPMRSSWSDRGESGFNPCPVCGSIAP